MIKKVICLALCILMTVAMLSACVPQAEKAPEELYVGYSRYDVTPYDYSVPLAGFGYTLGSTEVVDPLYITCIALKDGEGNTFLMYHCDFLGVASAFLLSKKAVNRQTGVPIDNIIMGSTHNHSAPAVDSTTDEWPVMEDYQKLCKEAIVKTAQQALDDLKPSKVFVTSKKCEKMTYVRHYVRKDGSINGHGGNVNELYVGYAAEVDDNMELIKFDREGGKDVILMNWQGHPRAHGGTDAEYFGQSTTHRRGLILSDVDVIRRNIEPALDCHFAFFLGASGNVNNSSAIREDRITSNYIEHGEKLTQLAVEASANFKEVELGTLRRINATVDGEYKNGDIMKINISVFAIADSVAFAIVPYEMFSESALQLKDYSKGKFDLTFMVTCAEGGGYGYIPTEDTYYYPVEAYEVGATKFAAGTAEKLVEGYKDLFDQLLTK